MFTMFLKHLLLLLSLCLTLQESTAATDKIVCYFASWAGYRNGNGAFKPENIDPKLCTHVLYAFLGVNPDGTLEILDSWNEIDLGGLEHTASLKRSNPDLKVLISIGGWNAGNGLLSGVVASSVLRQTLVESCISFFEQWGFDGIDVAWEYPVNIDKANFVKLLQEMKTAFNEAGYVLSVTAASTPLSSYAAPQISEIVDMFIIMTYDYYTPVEDFAGLNSPLYGANSLNASVNEWLTAGMDASKLVISIPFYGHSYSLIDVNLHDVGDPAEEGIAGPYTQQPGVLGYNEICEFFDDWTRIWDDVAQVPYLYDGENWVSYDDAESVGVKVKFAKDNGFAGVAVWSVDTDDFLGACGNADPLLQAIKDNIG